MPDVTLAICSRDRAQSLAGTLKAVATSMREASDLSMELLVLDDASRDADAVRKAVSESGAPVKLLFGEGRGLSRARNRVLAEASGTALVWTDDDVIPRPGWIHGIADPILRGDADVVAGRVDLAPHLMKPWMGPFVRQMMASTEQLDLEAPDGVIGANWAVRLSMAREIGYDEEVGAGQLGVGEETVLYKRLAAAGARVVGAPDSSVEHHFDASRVTVPALIKRAKIAGKLWAWMEYHFKTSDQPAPSWWRQARMIAGEKLASARERRSGSDRISDERLYKIAAVAYARQRRAIDGRPRLYA